MLLDKLGASALPPPTHGLFAVRVSRYASRARLSGPRRNDEGQRRKRPAVLADRRAYIG